MARVGPAAATVGKWSGKQAAHLAAFGVNSSVTTFTQPFTREFHYRANATGPDVVPPVESILNLWYSGRSEAADITQLLKWHGIPFTAGGPPDKLVKNAWWHAIDLQRPTFALEAYRDWYRQGRIGEPELRGMLARHGFGDRLSQSLFIGDWNNITEGLIMELWQRNMITEAQARYLLGKLGYLRDDELKLILAAWQPPPPAESLVLRNRNMITDGELDEYLKMNGYRRPEERKRIAELRHEIPGPSDLVRFAVREVFSPDLAIQYGFNQEMPQDFKQWLIKQGFDESFTVRDPSSGNTYTLDWPTAHWWAHWVWPSPTQAYAMLQRLRPTGGVNGGPRNPAGLQFTSTDLNALLKGSDYPPYFRPFLAEISYRKPDRQDVNYAYRYGQIDKQEAVEEYQDAGYNKADSERLADLLDYRITFRRFQQNMARVKVRILKAYQVGIVTRNNAGALLYLTTLENINKINAYIAMSNSERIAIAQADPYVKVQLDNVDTGIKTGFVVEAIRGIKCNFLNMNITEEQARQYLRYIGLTWNRVEDYLNTWKWTFCKRSKQFTAGQIQKLVTRGLLTVPEAVARLLRLGYKLKDAYIIIGLAQQDIAIANAKAERQLAKDLEARERATIALQKALEREMQQARRDLAAHGTPAKLQKWLKGNLIGQDEFTFRMGALGWPMDDIRRMAREVGVNINGNGVIEPETPKAT